MSLKEGNSADVFYLSGNEFADGSWRARFDSVNNQYCFEHREVPTETNITFDDAKKATIEADTNFTDQNHYTSTVLIDTRGLPLTQDGLSGDMTGRVIHWNGFVWRNFTDQWINKADIANTGIVNDYGQFRRMNLLDSDPDDRTKYPPIPVEGTTIGARNTDAGGFGAEMISVNSVQGVFGMLIAMIHGGPATPDQIAAVKAGGTPVALPYENLHLDRDYAIGEVVIEAGTYFVCNTAGPQTGNVSTNLNKWDEVTMFPINRIMIDQDGDVMSDLGNVLLDY